MYTVSKGPSKLVAKTRRGKQTATLETAESNVVQSNQRTHGKQQGIKPALILQHVKMSLFLYLRPGIPQNYEKYELLRDLGRKTNDEYDISSELSVPRPVFQTAKKSAAAQYIKLQQQQQKQQKSEQEAVSPQHEELIKYINDSWNMVVAANPYDVPGSPDSTGSNCSLSSNSSSTSSLSTTSTSTVYYNEPPSPVLVDFQPFDLETWWGKRIFNSITKNL